MGVHYSTRGFDSRSSPNTAIVLPPPSTIAGCVLCFQLNSTFPLVWVSNCQLPRHECADDTNDGATYDE
jgi:hypothetical protein